jgi:hypothetical protein
MEYAIEVGSFAMLYIPSFMKNGSGIETLLGGGYTYTQRGWRSHKVIFGK